MKAPVLPATQAPIQIVGVYSFGTSFAPSLSRYALTEMTSVLEHFAGTMSRRMSTFALDVLSA